MVTVAAPYLEDSAVSCRSKKDMIIQGTSVEGRRQATRRVTVVTDGSIEGPNWRASIVFDGKSRAICSHESPVKFAGHAKVRAMY